MAFKSFKKKKVAYQLGEGVRHLGENYITIF